jgi:NAD(P)H-nitrite reductase large subunit
MKVIIIGAGPAGISAAETLRKHDTTIDITLFSRESYPPYSPPAMIEYFLSGKEAHLWRWKDIPERLNLNFRPDTRVIDIMPEKHSLRLSTGEICHYDKALIATGSRLSTTVNGSDKKGIYNLKSFFHAKKLYDVVCEKQVREAIVIGAGFIGVEIALLLSHLKLKVNLLEMANQIMPNMLDEETAERALNILNGRGINVLLNTRAQSFLGRTYAETLELDSGEIIGADIFISATGITPLIGFLHGTGIHFNKGILVNDNLRTNIPDIYAAGDIVESKDKITGENTISAIFYNAIVQGNIAALNILGKNRRYDGVDRMNSLKHLGIPIIASGQKEGEILKFQQGDVLRKVYIKNDRLVGFQLIGDIRAAGILAALMNKKTALGNLKNRLLDTGFGMGYVSNYLITNYRW